VTLPPAQEIRFCMSSDGVRLAYATVGAGPPLVKAANWLSHLEFDWNSPVWRHWLRELARDHTLVRYDERGCGLSDWRVDEFSLDAWVRDLEAVVDALRLERFPIVGISQGGPIAIAYAVRHPERVSHLILHGSYSRGRSRRNPSDLEREELELMLQMVKVGWGKDHPAFRQVFTSLFIPDGSPEQMHWFNELERVSTTPENARCMLATFYELDVRDMARSLDVPTLVLHGTGDLRVPFEEGRLLAALIPGARLVPLESRNHLLLEDEPAWRRFLQEVRGFLGIPADVERPAAMAPLRRSRIETLFDQAIELGASDRRMFLARACGTDHDLRREVEALLDIAGRSGVTSKLAGILSASPRRPPFRTGVAPGRIVSHYAILEQLGVGGMGVVYKALDQRLPRYVALKFLPPTLGVEQDLKLRFMQEASAIATLDHPNLCTILEVDEEDGRLFIAMPFYEGETLKQRIERGPLAIAEAVDCALQVTAGLAHAHAAGVVHRDIKPANLIVTAGGRVKVLDFGIAKILDMSLTGTGEVLGTPAYMSPEQASGETVDHRTDLWALGVVLYEMLAGRPPFSGNTRKALFVAIQSCEPTGLTTFRPDLPPELEAVIERLLEKDRTARFSDAHEAAAALAASTGVTLPPPIATPPARSESS
jgi:pimeloyl-ACP methyl ester carboxylesterase